MATDEASFKLEFKKDVQNYLSNVLIWSASDRFTSGLPDFFILAAGRLVAIEAKFTKTLPKKKTSLVLSHEVSPAQKSFLDRVKSSGGVGLVVVGTPQAAAVFDRIQNNYTLEECLAAPRFTHNKCWQLGGFSDFWK